MTACRGPVAHGCVRTANSDHGIRKSFLTLPLPVATTLSAFYVVTKPILPWKTRSRERLMCSRMLGRASAPVRYSR